MDISSEYLCGVLPCDVATWLGTYHLNLIDGEKRRKVPRQVF